MKLEIDIHPVQAEILKVLLFKQEARFTDLNSMQISSDHFNFHVKRLVEIGLIEKNEDKYRLTPIGKEFSNRFDTDTKEIERQAKISVRMIGVKEKSGEVEYLVQERMKQPYYGHIGSIGGKIRWGETLFEAAQREIREETGLSGEMQLVGIQHKLDYSINGDLLEDKFFFMVKATNLTGELIELFEGGRNLWIKRNELLRLPKLFPNMPEVINMIEREELTYFEKKYVVEEY